MFSYHNQHNCLYNAGLWLKYKMNSINKLSSCYYRCLKLLFVYKRRYSVTQILLQLGLPSFEAIGKITVLEHWKHWKLQLIQWNTVCICCSVPILQSFLRLLYTTVKLLVVYLGAIAVTPLSCIQRLYCVVTDALRCLRVFGFTVFHCFIVLLCLSCLSLSCFVYLICSWAVLPDSNKWMDGYLPTPYSESGSTIYLRHVINSTNHVQLPGSQPCYSPGYQDRIQDVCHLHSVAHVVAYQTAFVTDTVIVWFADYWQTHW